MSSRRSRTWAAYALALLTVAIAQLLVFLVPAFVQRGAFILFIGAVAITAFYGGWGPAVAATILSALAAAWFVLPPADSIWIKDWHDGIRLGLFLLVAVLISHLHAARDRAQEQLKRSEQRLALALQAAHMGAWESDLRRGEFWWSPNLAKIFGSAPGTFSQTYEGFLGYIHPEDQNFLKLAVTRTLENGTDFEVEHRIVRPDGTVRWIITRGRISYDARGTPERMLGVATDITERKNAQLRAAAG